MVMWFMPWRWRDPRGICHVVSRGVDESNMRVTYSTTCGFELTVDDINAKTKVTAPTTCMHCASFPVAREKTP